MKSNLAQVSFQFKTQARLGEEVRIAGNCDSLGNWRAFDGPKLSTDQNKYPFWALTSSVSIPMDIDIEYKYVYIADGVPRWEELPNNRKIKIEHKCCFIEEEASSPMSRIIIKQQDVTSTLMHNYETSSFNIDENVAFTNTDPVIIASMRLPVKVLVNPNYNPSDPISEK